MGLMAFKGNQPTKSEALVSKSYLGKEEISALKLMVSGYLDNAEIKASKHEPMTMKAWVNEFDRFINFHSYPLLANAGSVSHDAAMKIASTEYEKYRKKHQFELTQVERDYLEVIHKTYKLLEGKKPKK
jgi:hypothetical protein